MYDLPLIAGLTWAQRTACERAKHGNLR